ncbi:uncharacterized protein LOC135335396 [Halichondria panicea]|uniref:uncharacterized protein LOC135335396 n=1 Tax=Halichondria panicea TaxID=6063 RepID=UPI00312B6764
MLQAHSSEDEIAMGNNLLGEKQDFLEKALHNYILCLKAGIIYRTALDHPHHCLYSILALSNASKDDKFSSSGHVSGKNSGRTSHLSRKEGSGRFVDEDKVKAASGLITKLRKRNPALIQSAEQLCDICLYGPGLPRCFDHEEPERTVPPTRQLPPPQAHQEGSSRAIVTHHHSHPLKKRERMIYVRMQSCNKCLCWSTDCSRRSPPPARGGSVSAHIYKQEFIPNELLIQGDPVVPALGYCRVV